MKIPLALADAASQRSGVLVAPPLNSGTSPCFWAYPAMVLLRIVTTLAIVESADEKTSPHVAGLLGAVAARQVYGDGSFGGLYQAEGEVMGMFGRRDDAVFRETGCWMAGIGCKLLINEVT